MSRISAIAIVGNGVESLIRMQMTGDLEADVEEISLYFHIPFCTRKCDYCHFFVLPDKELAKNQLAEGFSLELSLLHPFLINKRVATIYFGGGTPSLFGPERISHLLQLIKKSCHVNENAEVTLEVNPENVTVELMNAYREAGVNRVSIGVQTLDFHLLQLLGRLHDPAVALKAIESTYSANIRNISIDLMYDLPQQTLSHWSATLRAIQDLPITHLSLYNLTIEPHTVFFKKQSALRPSLPDEETSLHMYEEAVEFFEEQGLRRYEISAFAQLGFESKHNMGYWIARSFLGLGPSAFSYWEGKRFRNVSHLGKYCHALKSGGFPRDFEEKLDSDAHRRELFVIHLRLREGVDIEKFSQQHGSLDSFTNQTINRLIESHFLQCNQGRIQLTYKGVLFYDHIAVELI